MSPALKVWLERPGVSSTYFSPSADRGRTRSLVSTPSGSTTLSSFNFTTATDRRLPATLTVFGVMSDTTPTRNPPVRTSLPFTSLSPDGNCAFKS